jgi:hypothetical protein
MPVINVLNLPANKEHAREIVKTVAEYNGARYGCGILAGMAESDKRADPLKPAGFLLLFMGWILVLSALVLLKQAAARGAFVTAGMAVEVLGLVLVVRSHIAPKPERS